MATTIILVSLFLGLVAIYSAGRSVPVGFTTAFLLMHFVLVGLNFLNASLYAEGIFNTAQFFNYGFVDRAALPLGNGMRPALYLLCIYSCLLLGVLAGRRFLKPASIAAVAHDEFDNKKYAWLALAALAIIAVYKIASVFYLPSPLSIFLGNPNTNAGSLSTEIDTDTLRATLPYLMLPPVYQQLTLTIFTATTFMLMVAAWLTGSKGLRWIALAASLLLLAVNLEYLKRAPLMMIAIFSLVGVLMVRKTSMAALMKPLSILFVAALVCVVSIEAVYTPKVHTAIIALIGHEEVQAPAAAPSTVVAPSSEPAQETPVSIPAAKMKKPFPPVNVEARDDVLHSTVLTLARRVLMGESLEKYYAVENWGRLYPYAGPKYIVRYLHSLAGAPQESLGEYWYNQLRPDQKNLGLSTSQDIFLEMFMFFGPAAAYITAFLVGFLLMWIDSRKPALCTPYTLPFYIGFLLLIAMMATRGVLSVFFAGGGAAQLLMALGAALAMSERNPLGKLYAAIIRRLPSFRGGSIR
jgi:hypothetical protein